MSGVGGVGAVGMGAGAGAMSGVGFSGVSGASGVSVGSTSATSGASTPSLQGALPPGMQNLVQTLQDFSSAEILMALMLASATNRSEHKKSGDAALGFLAGMCLAGMMGQGQNMQMQIGGVPGAGAAPAAGGAAGVSLNASA